MSLKHAIKFRRKPLIINDQKNQGQSGDNKCAYYSLWLAAQFGEKHYGFIMNTLMYYN